MNTSRYSNFVGQIRLEVSPNRPWFSRMPCTSPELATALAAAKRAAIEGSRPALHHAVGATSQGSTRSLPSWLGHREVRRSHEGGWRHYVVDGLVHGPDEPGLPEGRTGTPIQFPSVTTINSVLAKPFLGTWMKKTAVEAFSRHIKKDQKVLSELVKADAVRASSALLTWVTQAEEIAMQAPDVVRDEAAALGTTAHHAIDALISGSRTNTRGLPFQAKNVADGFLMWKEDNPDLNVERGETLVYSEKFRYAGELDSLARDSNGKLVVLDWKTSNSVQREYAMQLAAYAHAVTEITGEEVSAAWCVRFGKFKPSYEACKVADLDASFKQFTHALELWRTQMQADQSDAWSRVIKATGK